MKKFLPALAAIVFFANVNAQNIPFVEISEVQEVSQQNLANGNDASPLLGDTVEIEGIVTFDPCTYGLSQSRKGTFLQDPDGGPWSGIHVLIDPGEIGTSLDLEQLDQATKFFDNFQRGNLVRCTGVVSTFSNNTQIALIPVETEIISLASEPDPRVTTIDTFNLADASGNPVPQLTTGEQYEGVLVEFRNVTITDVSTFAGGERIDWSLQDNAGNIINVRDVSGWFRNDDLDDYCQDTTETPWQFPLPNEGSQLGYIRGVGFDYALAGERSYWLAPRDTFDLGPLVAAAPVVRSTERDPIQPTSADPVDIIANIIDPDGSVDEAYLFYSMGQGSTSFTEQTMVSSGTDEYTATIPATNTDGEVVNYWVRAIDNEGDTTDYPATNSTSLNYITLDDGIDEISDLQFSTSANGNSIWAGDSLTDVDFTAVVTATQRSYDLGLITVQDSRDPYSGLTLQRVTGDNLDELRRGDSIRITNGLLTEEFNVTTFSYVQFEHLGETDVYQPVTTLHPDSVNAGVMDHAEAYESMFVRFEDAYVVDTNADESAGSNFGEWSFNTDMAATTGLRADDFSNDIPFGFNVDSLEAGQHLDFIQGILWYSFGNFKLLPRNQSDIAGFTTDYPKRITLFSFIGAGPGGQDAILLIDNENNLITTDDPLPAGTNVDSLVPYIEYEGETLNPGSGVIQEFSDTVHYTVTAPVDGSQRTYAVVVDVMTGIEELGQINTVHVLPNPASHNFRVVMDVQQAATYDLSIVNMLGAEVMQKSWSVNAGSNQLSLDVSQLPQGLYVVNVEGDKGRFKTKLQLVR